MFPDDRVLVGVINRKSDFAIAERDHWYRVPQAKAPRSVDAEVVAFYFSRDFKELNGGIHYYARRQGHELARRRELLPKQPNHPRADVLYYKIQLGEMQHRKTPILNPTRRPITFIYTTWDRFVIANTIADLYSKADWFVERVASTLQRMGITPERRWEDEDPADRIAQLLIQCKNGIVIATTGEKADGSLIIEPLDTNDAVTAAADSIRAAVQALGGPVFVNIPPQG